VAHSLWLCPRSCIPWLARIHFCRCLVLFSLVFVAVCLLGVGASPSSCTFVKSTNLNLLSSRLHVTSPSSESLSRCSALLPSCPHPRVCYLLLRSAAERCGHGPMFAAGDSSGAVSIVTYQGVSVRVAGAEDSQDGAMVLEGAGHHSGAVACVAFARNVETHRSHTHTHTHTRSSRMRVRALKHKWLPISCPIAPRVLSAPSAAFAINRRSVCTFQASQSYLHPSCTLRVDPLYLACMYPPPHITCILLLRVDPLYLAYMPHAAHHHSNAILMRTPEFWHFAPSNRMRLITTGNADLAIYEWLLKPVPDFLKRYVKSRMV
jgi:hypothetical protein